MPRQLTCPHGHQWEVGADGVAPADEPRVCPVCGSEPAHAGAIYRRSASKFLFWGFLLLVSVGVIIAGLVFWIMADGGIIGSVVIGGAALATFIASIICFSVYGQKQRTAVMADTCEAMSFEFAETLSKTRLGDFGPLGLFNQGHSRKGRNLMEGGIGETEAVLLDYQYTIGSGKSAHTYQQTAAVFPGAAADLPDFDLSPESFLHKIGKMFGYQDIDFEASPRFSSNYLLRGPDEEAIRAAFTPEVLDYFAVHPGWTVESKAGQFSVYRAGKQCKPDECPEFLATGLEILSLFASATSPRRESREEEGEA